MIRAILPVALLKNLFPAMCKLSQAAEENWDTINTLIKQNQLKKKMAV